MGLRESIYNYIEVTKPSIVSLLVFTSLGAMLLALNPSRIPLSLPLLGLATLSITAACAGCDTTTSYIDRDIDAIMKRTRHRPIPSGRISPPERALAWGLILIVIGLVLALSINFLSFVWIFLGVLGNVGLYSLVLKRRNPINIILGGISGGMPVMFGWSAITGAAPLLPWLLAALVVLWIPGHIWSLAIFTKDDYANAKIPMLPVVVSLRKALRCIVSTVVLMVPFSLAIYWLGGFGIIYLVIAVITGIAVLAVNFYLFLRPSEKMAYAAFKFSSPYLFVLFLAMVIDHLI